MRARKFVILVGWLLFAASTFSSAVADDPKKPDAKTGDAKQADAKKADDDYYELFKSLADTIDQVENNYVKDVKRRELFEAAIKGVLGKLDPYSSYIGPTDLDGFKSTVDNQFGGIGIQIGVERGQLKVISPLVGSPAYKAGVLAGDRIVKIDDEPTVDIQIDEAVRRLKGEVGTSVTISVLHAGSTRPETITITRELIHVDTVLGDRRGSDDRWDFMLDAEKRIGYIRITAFSRDTPADLKKALESLKARKMSGLVLDLRFNPGGLLTSAIEVSDLFVSDGVIVSTEGRNSPKRVWEAHKEGTVEGFPMVVLVNKYSASASEILSACLQDHKRAVVIGERTWGKGSVQNVIELEDGRSALKLTTASYQRPNGHNIHRFPDSKESDEWGVRPNDGQEVKLNDAETRRLIEYRHDRDILVAKRTEVAATPAAESREAAPKGSTAEAKENSAETPTSSVTSSSETTEATGEKTTAASSTAKPASRPKPSEFIDRQLQKAIEYLNGELAR